MNNDVVYLPEGAVREAASRFPTPFFLYEEARLRENARRFRETFQEFFKDFQPLFAVKANPNPEVLKILMSEGFGFDTSSYAEAWLAQKLGASGMHTSNYTETEELKFANEVELILNLDDASTVEQVKEFGMPKLVSFRINPGVGKGDGANNVFAGPDAKYGVPFEKAVSAYLAAREAGAERFGIHMMTGSNVLSEEYFVLIVGRLLDIVAEIKRETGIEIEFMNIGGGFGVPYRPEEKSLDLARVARDLRELMDRKCVEHGIKEPRLMAEPGRYISADCGFLVTKVVSIKDGYKKFVGVDANSSDMPRPAIYDAYHYVSVLKDSLKGDLPRQARSSLLAVSDNTPPSVAPSFLASHPFDESLAGEDSEKVSIVGSVCENSDQFAKDRMLPRCAIGDLVVIHNCGAHAYAMGSNYNGKLRHAEYLLEESEEGDLLRQQRRSLLTVSEHTSAAVAPSFLASHPSSDSSDQRFSIRCIRRAETLEDLFRTLTF